MDKLLLMHDEFVKKPVVSGLSLARFTRIREFLGCSMSQGESFQVFIERFKELKNRAEITDKYIIALVFLDSFAAADARLMMATMGQNDNSSLYDLGYMCAFTRRMDLAIVQEAASEAASEAGSSEAKKSKWADASSSTSSAVGSAAAPKVEWVSRFGKAMTQHRADGSCKECNGQFGKGHKCGSTGSSSATVSAAGNNGSKVIRMLYKRPKVQDLLEVAMASEDGRAAVEARRKVIAGPSARVVRGLSGVTSAASGEDREVATIKGTASMGGSSIVEETRNVDADSDTEMTESDEHTSEDAEDLLGRASLVAGMYGVSVEQEADLSQDMAAQECKFDAVFSAPPALHSNAICVPILVQNVVCFGIVDTGATFSCITDEFFDYLGGRSYPRFIAPKDGGVVQLAHEDAAVPCVGDVDLVIEYNKISCSQKFEVFSFYSDD